MNKLFFSVVIPTLNEEKYLPILLKSLTKQTYRDFEVILVDGKSDDKTTEVFQKFQSSMPQSKLITSEKRNVSHQRNLGAEAACGKYLVFLDADCEVDSTFLEELHIEAVKHRFPFATTWIRPDSNNTGDKLMLLVANLAQELAKGVNKPYAGGYNTIVTKEVFHKLKGFREDLFMSEDYDLALRAKKKGYDLTILKEPQVVWSLRRFRSIGTLPTLQKCTESLIHVLLKGPITKEIFDYPMGGQAHTVKKKQIDLTKFRTYLKGIEKLEKKIDQLLES